MNHTRFTVWLMQEAEQNHFSAEELEVALEFCGDDSPITWLQGNWKNMTDTVVTLATNYGHERKENNVGTISQQEARDALRKHKGNIWNSVTECVEQRQKMVRISPAAPNGKKRCRSNERFFFSTTS